MKNIHSFHIPVMGIGFTIDSPMRVSQFGIDSVVSLADDTLLEQLRNHYSKKYKLVYNEITRKVEDYRAKRITSYLDMMKKVTEKQFSDFKKGSLNTVSKIKTYFEKLPDASSLKKEFKDLTSKSFDLSAVKNWIKDSLGMGSIDVNIMTKLDGASYVKKEALPIEFNDAHAALRGFANSELSSSIVFSAGMNPALYAYLGTFEDFYPDANGRIKKRIILKVSDYRSAYIQGVYLAKKGLWVSEYRIESGLNCGGHAFATDGFLMGPILEEFKTKKEELMGTINTTLNIALTNKKRVLPENPLPLKITAQGGVGTAEEHQFLLEHYKVDSVGWGSPFLLVPEATIVDERTLNQLKRAKESDLFLSDISPLGVKFNSLKGSSKEVEKNKLIEKGKPGSPCLKKHLVFSTEFSDKPLCTASSKFQKLKIKDLDSQNLDKEKYDKAYSKITAKECLCMGLSQSALEINGIETKQTVSGISICPGPNLAYFSKIVGLNEMVDHIYGTTNIISRNDRPNMFMKELKMYLDYLNEKIEDVGNTMTKKQAKSLLKSSKNMKEGMEYYQSLFSGMKNIFKSEKATILSTLKLNFHQLGILNKKIEKLEVV